MDTKKVAKDTVIFQEGDVADVAYYVISGKVELSRSDRGQTLNTKIVGDNEVFGELAVFDGNSLRPYVARALEDTEIAPITPEEIKALTANASQGVQALLSLAFDKMKLVRTKVLSTQNTALSSGIKKITVSPTGEKMKALFKPVEVPLNRLPFRIGGFPEGGEPNRRDTVHLSLPSQVNPLRISRQHCEITIEDDAVMVVDLGSRFCTTVNGSTVGRGRGSFSAKLTMGKNTLALGNAESDYTLTVTCE